MSVSLQRHAQVPPPPGADLVRPRLLYPTGLLWAAVVVAIVGHAVLWAGPFREGQSAGPYWTVVVAALAITVPLAAMAVADLRVGRLRGAGLRSRTVVAASTVLLLGLMVVQVVVGGPDDTDLQVYQRQGAALVDTGGLPVEQPAEYPPLGVIVFGFATLLERALPIGFGVAVGLLLGALWIGTIAVLVRRVEPWAVAVMALWPTITLFVLIRYDALPTAFLVAGLAVAIGVTASTGEDTRRDSIGAGLLLGLGAAAKWTPGLAAVVLAVGWWRADRRRSAAWFATATAAGFLLPHLPFLLTAEQRGAVLDAYRFHAVRELTAESFPFLPLHLLGFAPQPDRPWVGVEGLDPAVSWVPTALLVLALLGPIGAAWWAPDRVIGWALLAPLAFMLGNRIYSPQFVLTFAALWAFGIGHHRATTTRQRLAVVGAAGAAATVGWGIWPNFVDYWLPLSWALFATMIALTVVAVRWAPVDKGRHEHPSLTRVR